MRGTGRRAGVITIEEASCGNAESRPPRAGPIHL